MSNIYDIIKQKANNYEDSVPADAWNNIMQEKKKRRPVFLWLFLGFLLSGLLIGGYMFYSNNHSTQDKNVLANNTNTKKAGPGKVNSAKNKEQLSKETLSSPEKEKINNSAINTDHNNNPAEKSSNTGDKNTLWGNSTNKSSAPSPVKNETTITASDNNKNVTSSSRKKINRKQNGKSLLKIEQGETESVDKNSNRNDNPIAVTKETNNSKLDKTVVTNEPKTEKPVSPIKENNIVPDQAQHKTVATTTPAENKKQEQHNKSKTGSKHPWFIDVAVTPLAPIQQYDHSIAFSRALVLQDKKADFKGSLENSHIDPSIAYSIALRKELNKKISVGLGVQWLVLKEHVSIAGNQTNTYFQYVRTEVNFDEGPGEKIDTIVMVQKGDRKFSAINSYTLLSIPVSVNYNLVKKNPWSLAVSAGVNVNVYTNYRNYINPNPNAVLVNTSQPANDHTGIGYSIFGGLRIERMISKKLSFFATPAFNYSPSQQQIKNSLINTKIHMVSVGLGASFKLR